MSSERAAWKLSLALLALAACAPAVAARSGEGRAAPSSSSQQKAQKPPSPERIVGDYLKAVGGRKRLAAVRDAVYEWEARRGAGEAGTARTQVKAPASARADILLESGESNWAANARTAWVRGRDGRLRTLTDREAYAAKLQALLDAGRLVDFKKQKVLARTVAAAQPAGGEPAYTVEFSTREGARLRYTFGAASKLLVQVADEARGLTVRFGDYRAPAGGAREAPLEPHRVEITSGGSDTLTLTLRGARYNTGLADSLFEPPGERALDVPALLRELGRNQAEADKRVNDYTFMHKLTERKVNDRGEVTKETTTVHEVYPVVGWGMVTKLVGENGVPLSPERAAKEEKRVAEELAKAEREAPGRLEKQKQKRAERAARKKEHKGGEAGDGDEDNVSISTFLRACELVAPRRERFRDRDVIVFDFRARPGFRPSNRAESVIKKLAGVVWVDPEEKQVMRLEARFVEGYKVAGGLVASLKPGSAFVFEQTRLADGVWLPRFSQVNASLKLFLFAGMSINETHEFSDYKRFDAKTGDAALDAPKPQP